MSTNIFNSGDEWAVQTPAQTFTAEVDSEIRRLEREGARAAMEESRKRTGARLSELRGDLILAWRALTEEEGSSISEALSVVAAEIHNATPSQEGHLLSDGLFELAKAAGRENL